MIYRFPIYVPGIAFAVALVAGAIGAYLLLRKNQRPPAFILFGVAALAGVIVAPMLALDRVVLDDEKLEQTTGFWFVPTVKGFRFDEIKYVTIDSAIDRNNREYEVWIVALKEGGEREIDPGDLWVLHGQAIIDRLREKGIEVRF